ncbi:MAG: ion transporter [Clostridia bacterium]|nr:ion transporter [Clostridia bacterium]
MKHKIYSLIESGQQEKGKENAFDWYDWFMMITIIISILPLAFHRQITAFFVMDKITAVIFIVDYLLRLFTADLKLKKGARSYLLYPFTPMAILDLISILPSLEIIGKGFRLLKIARLLRTFRVFRAFKVVRYSKSINLIIAVFKRQRRILGTVVFVAIGYVLLSALVIFNVEPDSFNTFFDALYWATISLTTVGYGDLCPVTVTGRIVTMLSAIFGIAIIALPSGVITAGFMEELRENKNDPDSPQETIYDDPKSIVM